MSRNKCCCRELYDIKKSGTFFMNWEIQVKEAAGKQNSS